MSDTALSVLLAIFVAHLVAFAVVGWRRRAAYYIAVVTTFAVLTASVAARLYVPDLVLLGERPVHEQLRWAAVPAAAVSLSWGVLRLRARRR